MASARTISAGGHGVTGLADTPTPMWLEPPHSSAFPELEEHPFSPDEYARRLRTVRQRMTDRQLAALLVFRPSSIEYLCGYHSAETAPQPLLVTHDETHLYVPNLELGRALTSSRADEIHYYGYDQSHRALTLAAEHAASVVGRGEKLGVELEHTSTPPQVLELLRENGVEPVAGDHLVERVRLVLSPEEIRCVENAAEITQRGVNAAVTAAEEPGATESSVAGAIAQALLREANSVSAWGPLVVTGRRSGIPHSTYKNNPISADTTFLEFSGTHHRYHAPVMRTLCGANPPPEVQRLNRLSTTVLDAVLGAAKPGVAASEVANEAWKAISPLPDDVVYHRLFGYPIGLAHPPHWMDGAPWHITADNHEPLQEGMVFHVPTALRSFGHAVVGSSQTFVVESSGTRVLTHGPANMVSVSAH